jgi:1,4-alpha-glucan branching enzyme
MDGPGQAYNALSGSDPVDSLLTVIGDFQNPAPWNSIRYLCGSHDQIYDSDGTHISQRYIVERFGGRSNGWALAKGRLAWALTVAIPGTPMLFMGTEGQFDGFWNPDLDGFGDLRFDWAKVGDPTGAPMQQMVRDVNNLRWAHPALKSPAGNVTHVDQQNQVVGFKRYNDQGDIVLVVVNVGDGQWDSHSYGVNMGGEDGCWMEIFNSQAPVYGGVNAPGNFGDNLCVSNNLLWMNLPCWSVVMFQKL